MRPSVKVWIGFQGKSLVSDVVKAAGFALGDDVCPWDWETPRKGVEWECIYGDDGNTLVGFGLPLLQVLGSRWGDPHIESLNLNGLEREAESLKLALVEFLERRQVPTALVNKVDTWICPEFG
jgi:hypothetical protein